MIRFPGLLLALFLALFSQASAATETEYSPVEATIEIGNESGDGIDLIDAGLKVRFLHYFRIKPWVYILTQNSYISEVRVDNRRNSSFSPQIQKYRPKTAIFPKAYPSSKSSLKNLSYPPHALVRIPMDKSYAEKNN